MMGVYQDHGIRFEYPPDWDVEEDDDGLVTTVAVHAPDGMAFALVRVDETRPAPRSLADEALDAMRDEYPQLDATPALETIGGHKAVGHDVEFFSFDMTNACAIRCFRTPRRTVLVFGQWSELDENGAEAMLKALRGSVEEIQA
jgi:hypothetical protein